VFFDARCLPSSRLVVPITRFVQPKLENPTIPKISAVRGHGPLLIPSSISLTRSLTPEVSDFTGKPDATGSSGECETNSPASFLPVSMTLRGFVAIRRWFCCTRCVPLTLDLRCGGLSWSVTRRRRRAVRWTALFWGDRKLLIMPDFLGHRRVSLRPGSFATSPAAWSTTRSRLHRLGKRFCGRWFFCCRWNFTFGLLRWLAEGQVTVREVRRMKFEGGVDSNLWGFVPSSGSAVLYVLRWRWSPRVESNFGILSAGACWPFVLFEQVVSLSQFAVAGLDVPDGRLGISTTRFYRWLRNGFTAGRSLPQACFWFRYGSDLRRLAEQGNHGFLRQLVIDDSLRATGFGARRDGRPHAMDGRWMANTRHRKHGRSLNADKPRTEFDGRWLGSFVWSLAHIDGGSRKRRSRSGLIGVFSITESADRPFVRSTLRASFLDHLFFFPLFPPPKPKFFFFFFSGCLGAGSHPARVRITERCTEGSKWSWSRRSASLVDVGQLLAACHREPRCRSPNDSGEVHNIWEFPHDRKHERRVARGAA